MKQFKQTLSAAAILLLFAFAACKKDAAQVPAPAPGNGSATRISKIEHATDYSEFLYNADGSLQSIVSKLSNGSHVGTLHFSYLNGKLQEATFGSILLTYTYTGDFVTKVETRNGAGTVTHTNEFAYLNNHLSEMVDYWPNGAGGLRPFGKTKYFYNGAGNPVKTELFDYVNNAWVKTETVDITDYDDKANISGGIEDFIYLPQLSLYSNNPLKREHRDPTGVLAQTLTHTYLYDAQNRPTQRTTVTKVPGLADVVEVTRFHY